MTQKLIAAMKDVPTPPCLREGRCISYDLCKVHEFSCQEFNIYATQSGNRGKVPTRVPSRELYLRLHNDPEFDENGKRKESHPNKGRRKKRNPDRKKLDKEIEEELELEKARQKQKVLLQKWHI